MKPFVILALPRTGTKMLITALESHPDMPKIIHEFRGDYDKFLAHPYVLSNKIQPWMKPPIKIMHVGREDAEAGALSLIKMGYPFSTYDIPEDEIQKLAAFRRETEAEMKAVAQWSTTYEALTNNEEATQLNNSDAICKFFGVTPEQLIADTKKTTKPKERRTENVFTGMVNETIEKTIAVPANATIVQLVSERRLFEFDAEDVELYRMEINIGDGWRGAGFDAVKRDGDKTVRPGQRRLWDWYHDTIPSDLKTVGVRVVPHRPFVCCIHVDFL